MADTGASRPEFPIADRPAVVAAAPVSPVPQTQPPEPGVLVTPGDDVPAARSETRGRIGPSNTPMVEVDRTATVHFIGGDWFSLTGFTKPPGAPLKVLVAGSPQAAEISDAIAAAIRNGTQRVFDFEHRDHSGTCLMVLPIPSAIVGGQLNALIGVSSSADLNFAPARASMDRHRVTVRRQG